MRICTFNVNSIKARAELLFSWLKKRSNDIDVLCLQELKVQAEAFPFKDFEDLGYHCYINPQKTYNGVAICSKVPADAVITDFGSSTLNEQKRLILVRLAKLSIINVYAPHGDDRGLPKYQYKLSWYEEFSKFLQSIQDTLPRSVLVGDFNVALSDIDVYDAELLKDTIGTMPEEREAFSRLLKMGLVDCFRAKYPHKKAFTWWSYLGGAYYKDEGMRIDYILSGRQLADALRDIEIDTWTRKHRSPKPSDHAPVIAEFEI